MSSRAVVYAEEWIARRFSKSLHTASDASTIKSRIPELEWEILADARYNGFERDDFSDVDLPDMIEKAIEDATDPETEEVIDIEAGG